MIVGSMELALRLEGCHSLKEKRHVVRGLLERLRREFGVAAAEVGDLDLWGNATIGVACVSNSSPHAESVLQHALDAVDSNPSVQVESVSRTVERR